MYGYIKGIITDIQTTYVVIENNNIGYNIYVANPYHYRINDQYLIHTYTYVKEDEISLYGFFNNEEKDMFLKLISVKGIGPKAALSILSSSTVEGIMDAINRENILYLKKIPKIGDKAARQIILDLKGKLAKDEKSNVNSDLIEALEALGYKARDINKIIGNVDNTKSLEEQIKDSLKLLLK